jgi:hypothetical protein
VAVDDVANRHTEASREFFLEPGRKLGAQRVRKNDALVRDHESRAVIVSHRLVHAAGDVDDLVPDRRVEVRTAQLGSLRMDYRNQDHRNRRNSRRARPSDFH